VDIALIFDIGTQVAKAKLRNNQGTKAAQERAAFGLRWQTWKVSRL
jgi:sugar (pentulose or hexulose) kinase